MTPQVDQLTAEQQATIAELQTELADLNLEADEKWAKYLKTKDVDCFNEVVALESEIEMKALIAHVPKAGEGKVSKVRGLIARIKGQADEDCPDCTLPRELESRLRTLEAVNMFRVEIGLPPLGRLPRGVVGDSHECTIAKAFQIGWEGTGMEFGQVSISGGGGNSLHWKDATGEYRSLDLIAESLSDLAGRGISEAQEYMESWEEVVNHFDSWEYLDLVHDNVLLDHVENQLDEGEYPREAIDEVRRRGLSLLEQLVEQCSDLELGEDGELLVREVDFQ